MKPKVSVIIPVYNRLLLARRAIESVLNQPFTDYEIIVVDDGSTCDTDTLGEYTAVRYFRQDHAGAPAARNRGIREATGKYIAFLDSDDWFAPDKLEKQVAIMEANPECLISHTSYIRQAEGKDAKVIKSGKFSGKVYPRLWFHCPIAMPTVMIRADCMEGHGFREDIDCADDLILWAELARMQPIIGIDEPLSVVSVNANTNAFNPLRQIVAIHNIVEYGIYQDINLSPVTRAALTLYWMIRELVFTVRLKFVRGVLTNT